VLPGSSVFQAFSPSSYFNTPIPAGAPIDSQSGAYIADAAAHAGPGMMLTLGAFAQPFFWAQPSDPLRTVTPSGSGPTVTIHVPASAAPMPSSDAEMTIFDPGLNVVAGFWKVVMGSGGSFTCQGTDQWKLSSNGLASSWPQSDAVAPMNTGHRGSPAPCRAIRMDEVQAGLIPHKLSTFWFSPAAANVFPMSGFESGKTGLEPEGMLLRIKQSVDVDSIITNPAARVIAHAFRDYGVYIGDTSGSGCRVKVEANQDWASLGITATSVSAIPWSSWEFVERGYGA
jgi:hypothetical protein